MKKMLKITMITIVFLALVAGVSTAAPTMDYIERENINGTFSYYGFSQVKLVDGFLDGGNLFQNNANVNKRYIGTNWGENTYNYSHNALDNVSIGSTAELLWIMENIDATGTFMLSVDGNNAAQTLLSGTGFLLGTNTAALSTAANDLANLTDNRTLNGSAGILQPLGLDSWVLLDAPNSHSASRLHGFALYEVVFDVKQTFISDGSGLHNVISAPTVVPAPGALLLTAIGLPIVGWIRRRKA